MTSPYNILSHIKTFLFDIFWPPIFLLYYVDSTSATFLHLSIPFDFQSDYITIKRKRILQKDLRLTVKELYFIFLAFIPLTDDYPGTARIKRHILWWGSSFLDL